VFTWYNTAPTGPRPSSYGGFTIILRHTTPSRNPLEEWSISGLQAASRCRFSDNGCISVACWAAEGQNISCFPQSVLRYDICIPRCWSDDWFSESWLSDMYRDADKSRARSERKQARKHVRNARDFNKIDTRAVIKSFFSLQGKALKEIHVILTETLACFLPGRAKDLSALL